MRMILPHRLSRHKNTPHFCLNHLSVPKGFRIFPLSFSRVLSIAKRFSYLSERSQKLKVSYLWIETKRKDDRRHDHDGAADLLITRLRCGCGGSSSCRLIAHHDDVGFCTPDVNNNLSSSICRTKQRTMWLRSCWLESVGMSYDDDNNDETTLSTQTNNDNNNIDSSIEVVNTPHITHTTHTTTTTTHAHRTTCHCRPRYHPYALTLTSNSPLRMDTAKRVTITEPHFVRQSTNECGNHCA